MKSTICLLSLLFCGHAFAYPGIGDVADYSGTAVIMGQEVQFEKRIELIDFDAAANKFKKLEIYKQEGSRPTTEESWVSADEFMSKQEQEHMLADCAGQGGTLEAVTVNAGQFLTCRFSNDEGEFYNMGVVPFGLIKVSGEGWTMQLDHFSQGR
ncbi:MAG TPA: hypothetical protein VIH99_13460 [Bdellovibrionota bacterium]|jgi:hypothetical protein